MEKKCKVIYLNNFIYILSDDEIKEGDWVYSINYNNILQLQKPSNKFFYKKIIATTDTNISSTEITPFGRQFTKPSQQFIEKYIESYNKGNIITDVLVEYEDKFIGKCIPDENGCHCYDKNIVKINPKDNTITIKKLKDSWNREEVIILLNKLNNTLNIGSDLTLEQWIEKNL